MTVEAIKRKIMPILKRQGVIKAAIFGSFARGEETKNSDIDFLMKITKNKTLFDVIKLKLELEKKLGRNVDIVEFDAIHPLIRKAVLQEQQKIL